MIGLVAGSTFFNPEGAGARRDDRLPVDSDLLEFSDARCCSPREFLKDDGGGLSVSTRGTAELGMLFLDSVDWIAGAALDRLSVSTSLPL